MYNGWVETVNTGQELITKLLLDKILKANEQIKKMKIPKTRELSIHMNKTHSISILH